MSILRPVDAVAIMSQESYAYVYPGASSSHTAKHNYTSHRLLLTSMAMGRGETVYTWQYCRKTSTRSMNR
eukprot:330057-Pleurochrysis_carterae.AAC.1